MPDTPATAPLPEVEPADRAERAGDAPVLGRHERYRGE